MENLKKIAACQVLLARTFLKELKRKVQYNFRLFPCGTTTPGDW
jgi:hypothetical protein